MTDVFKTNLFAVTIPCFVLWLYFLPLLIARRKQHTHVVGIGILNLLLGWTFMGWVASLAWAYVPTAEYRLAHRIAIHVPDKYPLIAGLNSKATLNPLLRLLSLPLVLIIDLIPSVIPAAIHSALKSSTQTASGYAAWVVIAVDQLTLLLFLLSLFLVLLGNRSRFGKE